MEPTINFPSKEKVKILSLGAESVGRFAFYNNRDIFISENFGDMLEETNFLKYKKAILDYLKKEKIKQDAIITDLHPLYKTTLLGEELARKFKIPHIKFQHHIAHIFSALGDYMINSKFKIQNSKFKNFIGIAADGTGYGFDGNIWGGEVFQVKSEKLKVKSCNPKFKINKSQNLITERIGSLEEQTMIGGDLAVMEPARMLIAILAKTKNQKSKIKNTNQNSKIIKTKEDIYKFVKKYYSRNEFELLYNQLEQGFNCQKTTSAGRVLDAASVLLGFAGNERNYKHEAAKLLEKNSTIPYDDYDLRFTIYDLRIVLDTTYLFEYLIKNIHKDKKRLAATIQEYIAKGFYEITKLQITNYKLQIFFAGGMANNKIMSRYLEECGVYTSKKIPRGDEGIAVGQVVYYLLNNYW